MIKYTDFIVQIDKGITAIDDLLESGGISIGHKLQLDCLEEEFISLKDYLQDQQIVIEEDPTGTIAKEVCNVVGIGISLLPRNYSFLDDIITEGKSPLHILTLAVDKLCNWVRELIGVRPVMTTSLTVEALTSAGLFGDRKEASADSEASSIAMKY